MTAAVRQLLDSFDALSDAEKQEAVIEVLRRSVQVAPGDIPNEVLVAAAADLFLDLDAREADDTQP